MTPHHSPVLPTDLEARCPRSHQHRGDAAAKGSFPAAARSRASWKRQRPLPKGTATARPRTAPTAAEKTNPDVPFEQKGQQQAQGFGWCWVTAQLHGVAGTQPHPEPREAADAAAEGDEDGDRDLLCHPELSWQTQPTIARGSNTGTGDGGEQGSALGASKKKKKRNPPNHHPQTMGPLIKIKSAVKQVVPEHGSGSPVGPAEVGPLREEVLPAAPRMSPKSPGASESPSRAARLGSGQGGGPGCGVTSSPQAAGWGWGQGCVVPSGEGTRGVRDPELSQTARNSPPGRGICLYPILAASPTPRASAQQAGTPGVGEDRDPTDPAIPSLPKSPSPGCNPGGFSLFSGLTQHLLPRPPPWAQLSTSVPREGPAHAATHTPRITAPGHGEATEPVAAGQEVTRAVLWGPD